LRSILRAVLAVALLLGSGLGDWTLGTAQSPAHESCCCGMAADAEDTCPCPKPENAPQNQRGSQNACANRLAPVVLAAPRRTAQAQRRVEPRPEPATRARAACDQSDAKQAVPAPQGRDPDLGRHLAGLSTYRI